MTLDEWIKTTEKLPKVGERCLAYPIDGEMEVVDFAEGDIFVLIQSYAFPVKSVTHWMPLPDKPEVGEYDIK